MSNISVFSDGGCNGKNARDGDTYGSFKVFNDAVEVHHERIEHGVGSNNTSEFKTLIKALAYCLDTGRHNPTVYIDSRLVYHQCRGEWRVKDERLKPLRAEAEKLIKATGAELVWTERSKIVEKLGH
jgi:ribonuclease HI